MSSTLGEEISIDYSELRGEPPSVTTKAEYIARRKRAHGHTKTHHLISNLDITFESEKAQVNASCMIFREYDGEFFNSHVLYCFDLENVMNNWLIVSIRQDILWNEGNSEMHKGVPKETS
jgi:hypothetical protein